MPDLSSNHEASRLPAEQSLCTTNRIAMLVFLYHGSAVCIAPPMPATGGSLHLSRCRNKSRNPT
jgi:hypothetical protein